MAYKKRCKSKKLLIYENLTARMRLPDEDWRDYVKLLKGYEGEVKFDGLTEQLQCHCIVLNDLLLEVGGKEFQIDTLVILLKKLCLFEVKNLNGEYIYTEDECLIKLPDLEIDNPLVQMKRCETALRQLLRKIGYSSFPIDSSVVFVNSEFTLLQAPLDKPFIRPTQLYPFLRKLNNEPSILTDIERRLAEKLVSLHRSESRYDKFPVYRFDQLQKKFMCRKCRSSHVKVEGKSCVCQCGEIELVEDAIMRHVREFQLLFPNEKITTKIIHEWCGGVRSRKRISIILDKYFKRTGSRKLSYYI